MVFLDAEHLVAPSAEEEASPCNAEASCSKQGLSKRSKYGALTVVALLLLVGLVLTATVVQQKAPLQSSTDFIEEDMDQDMLDAVNQERTQRGLSALCYNSKLINAASAHTEDMAYYDRMSHTGSDGSDPGQRITRAGYGYSAYCENVAYGQRSVSSVMNSWMNSEGHRANILNSGITHFGYAKNDKYWTQVFASGSSESCSQGFGGGDTCAFPTTYGGKTMPGCTTEGHDDKAWCYTTAGPGKWRECTAADNACSFPFTYEGTEYWHGCTKDGHHAAWCYTAKGSGDYKVCSAADDACEFPFTYKDKEYRQCTNVDYTKDWCYKVGGGWMDCF
ncbi:unnamed protein product [Prorocentrum cordatum]|uniref:Fibronectin type-II domain-containing protein n=1 Tax=Prorocentrum cordatum TaxID=2364126 RepID=A0ABN9R286_9DINO|nr:unnamed protein product [Polarella glacialis]